MNRLLSIRSVRLATILVAMAAWIGATNHCALRCIEKATQQCCCPAHEPAPADHGTPTQPTCCTSLRAILEAPPKAPASNEIGVALLPDRPPAVLTNGSIEARHQPELADTGPPRAATFAELVLQRCVPSHAPPFVV